jgi:hypothetical protein
MTSGLVYQEMFLWRKQRVLSFRELLKAPILFSKMKNVRFIAVYFIQEI